MCVWEGGGCVAQSVLMCCWCAGPRRPSCTPHARPPARPRARAEWYESEQQLLEPLLACYWSLWECGGGIIAEGAPAPPPCAAVGRPCIGSGAPRLGRTAPLQTGNQAE